MRLLCCLVVVSGCGLNLGELQSGDAGPATDALFSDALPPEDAGDSGGEDAGSRDAAPQDGGRDTGPDAGSADAGPDDDACASAEEVCNGIDDDCDGEVDRPGPALCTDGRVCRRGDCLPPAGELLWAQTFGATGAADGENTRDVGWALDLRPGGGATIAGQGQYGALDFGGGSTGVFNGQYFAATFDRDGVPVASFSRGNGAFPAAFAVRRNGTELFLGGVVQGSFEFGGGAHAGTSDAFVARYDDEAGAYGAAVRTSAVGIERVSGLAPLGEGVVAVGHWGGDATVELPGGSMLFEVEGQDGYVMALDRDGTVQWYLHVGGEGSVSLKDVVVHGDRVWVAGNVLGELVVGTRTPTTHATTHGLVLALDPSDGTVAFSHVFGGDTGQVELQAIVGVGDDIAIGGAYLGADVTIGDSGAPLPNTSGSLDIYVARLSDDATERWVTTATETFEDRVRDLATNGDDLVLVGDHGGLGLGDSCPRVRGEGGLDILVANLDAATGTCRWLRGYGGPGNDSGNAVGVEGDRVYVTGAVRAGTDFGLGGGPLVTADSDSDIFLLGFAP